jgi:hypothetical protein
MLMSQTALGRWVNVENWRAHHEDAILRILWDIKQLGGAKVTAGIGTFSNATGLDMQDTIAFCADLQRRGLIQERGKYNYRLSPVGNLQVIRRLARARLRGPL